MQFRYHDQFRGRIDPIGDDEIDFTNLADLAPGFVRLDVIGFDRRAYGEPLNDPSPSGPGAAVARE